MNLGLSILGRLGDIDLEGGPGIVILRGVGDSDFQGFSDSDFEGVWG